MDQAVEDRLETASSIRGAGSWQPHDATGLEPMVAGVRPRALLANGPLGAGTRASGSAAQTVLRLQRCYGNAAVQALIARSAAAAGNADTPVVQRQPRRGRPPAFTEADVRRVAGTSPRGAAATAILNANGVSMVLRRGGGTFYDSASNSMSIDTAMQLSEAALAMIHEASHAEDHHAGRDSDATTLTRNEYIRIQIDQEVEATVRENQARMQMQAAGENVRRAHASVQGPYARAYRAAVARARRRDPAAAAADLDLVGVEAGRRAVRREYMSGRVRTSNDNRTYPQYWGRAWDRANRGRRP